MVPLGMVSGELPACSSADSCGFPGSGIITFSPVLLGAWPAWMHGNRAAWIAGAAFPPGAAGSPFAMPGVWAKGVPGSPAGAAHFSRAGMSRGANALACDAGGALDLCVREEKIMVPGGQAGGGQYGDLARPRACPARTAAWHRRSPAGGRGQIPAAGENQPGSDAGEQA